MPAAPDERVKRIVHLFLQMYEEGRWKEGTREWPDEERDGDIDSRVIRADGRVLALEHTLIEPFDGNRDEFERLRRYFLPLFEDAVFRMPGVATYLNVSRDALKLGAPCASLAQNLREWTRLNLENIPVDGQTIVHRIRGAGKGPEFDVTVRRQQLSSLKAFFLVRRFGRPNVVEVVEKVLPLAYPRRPELREGIRACRHGRYVIFYQFDEAARTILILRVLHGARDLATELGSPDS